MRRVAVVALVCALAALTPNVLGAQTVGPSPTATVPPTAPPTPLADAPPFVIRIPDLGPQQARDRAGTGALTAFVDGQRCASGDVSRGSVVLQLGLPGQPEPCGRNGATVTFVNAAGQQLFTTLTVARGTSADLTNLAPMPPVDGPGLASSPMLPPKAGHGSDGARTGGRRERDEEAAIVALASALLALIWMQRRSTES